MAEKSEKKVKVILSRAVTFKGIDYPAGEQELPEDAANLAVKKKLGKIAGESDGSQDSGFTPLSVEETMERFQKMDFSDEVMKSMQFHKEALVDKFGPPNLFEDDENSSKGLPEDFPMRHVFTDLGFKSVAEVQAKTREQLIDLNGIGEATADKALAYGK